MFVDLLQRLLGTIATLTVVAGVAAVAHWSVPVPVPQTPQMLSICESGGSPPCPECGSDAIPGNDPVLTSERSPGSFVE
jgi:hypothetical protein